MFDEWIIVDIEHAGGIVKDRKIHWNRETGHWSLVRPRVDGPYEMPYPNHSKRTNRFQAVIYTKGK